MDRITYCIYCRYRTTRKVASGYISPEPVFQSFCTATRDKAPCENRNTDGNCRYYIAKRHDDRG